MDNENPIKQFARAVFHELFRCKMLYKSLAVAGIASVMVYGYLWEKRYTSISTLTVAQKTLFDATNERVEEQLGRLVTLFNSAQFETKIAESLPSQSYLAATADPDARIAQFLRRSHVAIEDNGLLRFSHTAGNPENAQAGLNAVINVLLELAKPTDRLDEIASHSRRLSVEESQLRRRLSEKQELIINLRSSLGSADASRMKERISSIRESMQDVQVTSNAVATKIDVIQRQLQRVESIAKDRHRLELLLKLREVAEKRYAENLSLYVESDPEMISLQQERDNLSAEINQLRQKEASYSQTADESLYRELNAELALSEVEQEALQTRLDSLKLLLEDELGNASSDQNQTREIARISTEAESVQSKLQEVLLQQRENASLEKRVREATPEFIIVEPPFLPLRYSGFGVIELLLVVPLVAFALPMFIASLLVLCDSKIRTGRQLTNFAGTINISVLGVVPHYDSPGNMLIFRRAMWSLLIWIVGVLGVYVVAGTFG